LCSSCIDGYTTANGGTSCTYNCGILNCALCNSSISCQTCINSYTLSATATSCTLACSPGFFVNSNNGSSCQSCSLMINNCATCSYSSLNGSVICSACLQLYFLTASGTCTSCSSVLSNCLFCSDPVNCLSCTSGYNLVFINSQYVCQLPYTCNVANCYQCSSTNSSQCTNCSNVYYLTNGTCSLITCLDVQYYDGTTSSCVCPDGLLLINQKCTYCSIASCTTCNSGGCIKCESRYYLKHSSCASCLSNCISCTSGSSCLSCDYGYQLSNHGSCTKSDNTYSST
jgi:hypothetical protein